MINKDRLGLLLIFAGVSIWIPYFTLIVLGMPQPVFPFLAAHLSGVIPGALIRKRKLIAKLVKR